MAEDERSWRWRIGRRGAESVRRRAEAYADDPEKTRVLLDEARQKAEHARGRLGEVWESLMALMRLVSACIARRYSVPWTTLVLAISAVLYFLMPIDLVPDWLIGVGLLDDAAVIGWVIAVIKHDLDEFREWERRR